MEVDSKKSLAMTKKLAFPFITSFSADAQIRGVFIVHFLLAVIFIPLAFSMSGPAVAAIFIFYQPIVVLLTMLWLWTVVIWFFERKSIKYSVCFMSDHHRHLMSVGELTHIDRRAHV